LRKFLLRGFFTGEVGGWVEDAIVLL
jgi:hypothetical protein